MSASVSGPDFTSCLLAGVPIDDVGTTLLIGEAIAGDDTVAGDGKIRAVRHERTDDDTGKNNWPAEIGRAASSLRGTPRVRRSVN